MEEKVLNTEETQQVEQPVKQEVEQTEETPKKKVVDKKSPEYKRSKIDKLLAKQKIKYRGPFSYRTIRFFGYILMLLGQAYIIYSIVSKVANVPSWSEDLFNVFEVLSIFAVPLFLMANFCVIMSSNKNIKRYLIFYTAVAIGIYLLIVFIYYRYVYGISYQITDGDKEAAFEFSETIAKRFFLKIINYNVFVDLSLFSLFYFFMFYTPKKVNTNKKKLAFRLCSLIPVVLVAVSCVVYGLHYMSVIDLPVAVLAIMPCRSPAFYIIFFVLALLLKLRKYKFKKYGGTEEEYETYTKSNRSSLEVSTLAAIVIAVISLIDFFVFLFVPNLLIYGFGLNFYLIVFVPFIFLVSYTRKPKYKIIDTIMPFVFIALIIICYLEGVLYFFKII